MISLLPSRESRARSPSSRHRREIWISAVIGLAFSLALFALMRDLHRQRIVGYINTVAAGLDAMIDDKLHSEIDLLRGLAVFMRTEKDAGRSEFQGYASALLEHHPEIESLQWIPRVAYADRAACENRARREGLASYQFMERDSSGTMVRAADRDWYYPVYFHAPMSSREGRLGQDQGSEPAHLTAMMTACDSGTVTATSQTMMSLQTSRAEVITVFAPVFNGKPPYPTVAQRRANLRGFVAATYRMKEMLAIMFEHTDFQHVNLCLLDATDAGDPQVLYSRWDQSIEKMPSPAAVMSAAERGTGFFMKHHSANRQWYAVMQPSSEFLRKHFDARSYIVLMVCLLLTALGTYSVYAAYRRAVRIKQIVVERTSELTSSTLKLITEVGRRQLAEEELDRFFTLTLEGLCITGTDGYFKRVNPALVQILGYTEQELLAVPYWDLVHPDDVASTLREVHKQSEGQNTIAFENRYRRKDGNWIWLKWNSAAYPDQQLVYAVAHEVTEEKLARQALSQSEQQFKTLFAEAPVAFVEQDLSEVVDYLQQLDIPEETDIHAYLNERPEVVEQCVRRRRFVRANFAALTLYGASDQESLFTVLANHDRRDTGLVWANVLAAIRQRNRKLVYESRIVTLDGKWRDVICQLSVPQSSQSEWALVLGSIVDMTDRKEAEAQRLQAATLQVQIEAERRITELLRRSNEQLEEFTAVASHDLQEPLRKIQAYSTQLAAKFSQQIGEEGGGYLQRIGSAVKRMQNMITDLLALARVTTQATSFKPVDLEAEARDVLTDLDIAIQHSQAQVEVGDLPRISADPTQIRQLLQNLVGNALKFRKPNEPPRISVKGRVVTAPSGAGSPAGASSPFCEITVEDNGIGFDEQYSERIFQPFQKLHGRGEYEGNGIGLSICRKIVTRHHGTIVAEGLPNSGSRFTVTLPVSHYESETTS